MRTCLLCVAAALAGCVYAKQQDQSLSVDQAIRLVQSAADCVTMSSPYLQVAGRLRGLLYEADYKYDERHAATWMTFMLDDNQNMYARLCAAYLLLDQHDEAREFVKAQLASKNLRHRYNAAKVVELHVGRDSSKTWGVNLLIRLLSDGSIDGSGVVSSPPGECPDGDGDDIMMTPIDDICWSLGFMKEKEAVPALMSVLKRTPKTSGAAFALGEIGDDRAVPILMTILKDRAGYFHEEVRALGKLKASEAVPILVSRLGHPVTTFSGLDILETGRILEALAEIGDRRAIPPIEEYLKGPFPKEPKAVARRALAQLKSPDPVASLLALLETETYEPERSDIITALTKYRDDRVVKELSVIGRTSDSAFMRREAIFALKDIGNRKSLLVLASLLDVTFSRNLKAEWGWKITPDFQEYFPETIAMCLKQCTKQDFGKDPAKWEEWIAKNVEEDAPADAGNLRR